MRRGPDDKNTGYPWNRKHVPFGSDTSSDQLADGDDTVDVGTSSTNSAAETRPCRPRQRWKLLKASLSRPQNSRALRRDESNRRQISVHSASLRRLRLLGIGDLLDDLNTPGDPALAYE